jgi:hypothetical protein
MSQRYWNLVAIEVAGDASLAQWSTRTPADSESIVAPMNS